MNLLQQKLYDFLFATAKKSIATLPAGSPYIKAITKIDVDSILKDDLTRICKEVSWGEIGKILSIGAFMNMAEGEKRSAMKSDIKKVAQDIVARVERKSGKLRTPDKFRKLLLNI